MNIPARDLQILRKLAREKAEIAASPIQQENIRLWKKTNDLKMDRPPVFINEIPWNEMNVDDELTILCENSFCQYLETNLRQEIYSWKHMPGNMVVSPFVECPPVLADSGFGIEEDVDIVRTDATSDIVSRDFHIQIKDEEDIYKIKDPLITYDKERTEDNFQTLCEIFDGILEVKKTGVKGYWFTPWDYLIRLTGITEAMIDLIERPEYIDMLVKRFVDASMSRLKQYESFGVWGSNNDNTRVGSGGYGYCSNLGESGENLIGAPLKELWGCGNAQIFSSVSPDMHWEFSLKHELRWIERFGLSYYGCCEPLYNKLHIIERIPNLRKISMSPWNKLDVAAEIVKDRYVLSCKPNPAVFAAPQWDPDVARKEIEDILQKTEGCNIEIVMKDISTVRYCPQRLWEWSNIALETIGKRF